MYKIKMLCFEPNGFSYEDEPVDNGPFNTIKEAYDAAYLMAEDEVEFLNYGCDNGISFGIVEDNDFIRVNYYYNEENDTTGNTEQVTVFWVEKEEDK